ncbi:MAG: histidinol dehydrogenase, partial [Holophagales bacterium]|nr:histidinol dehydrogenase [Holophagales bacterium]
ADSRAGIAALEGLERRGEAILDRKVSKKAASIVESVRQGGDRALLGAVRRFDGVATGRTAAVKTVADLRLTAERADRRRLPPGFEHALERAIVAVERYHEHQRHPGFKLADSGVELVEHRRPFGRVGIYIPGGRATYPSSVVMTVTPARLAGVQEIVIATPRSGFARSPALRHAIERLGVSEVWAMGGAHAVAALAYGTETIRRVDKIVGPGNAWVTAAKHLVSAHVAIDSLAGPSEVVIVAAGDGVDPELVAADMLAQAEHDPQATALLLTDRAKLAKAVAKELRRQLKSLATAGVARESLRTRGLVVVVPDMETALSWTERIAPEHLQLVGAPAEALAEKVRNAGAVFVGEHTPEVFGDYLAGPSHVLPTTGAARYSSALGVEDFVRRSHVIRFDAEAARRCSAAASNLAEVEGLPAHAASARLRGRDRSRGS